MRDTIMDNGESEVKQKIFESVMAIAGESRPENVTMEMIARKSKMATATLYRHFKDKNKLITYVILRSFEPYCRKELEVATGDASVIDKLTALAGLIVRFDCEVKSVFGVLMGSLSGPLKEITQEMRRLRLLTQERLAAVMEDGLRSGVFGEFTARMLKTVFLGTILGIMRKHNRTANPDTTQDADLVMELFMYGVGRQEGTDGRAQR